MLDIKRIRQNPEEIRKMVELLDETYPKGVFKDLNAEIRKMVAANKKKQQ